MATIRPRASARLCSILAVLITLSTVHAGVTVKYQKTSDWPDGFVGQFTLTNPDATDAVDWKLEFDLPRNISNLWGGRIDSHKGDYYTVVPESWSRTIAKNGGSLVVGFQGSPGDAPEPTNIRFGPPSSAATPAPAQSPPSDGPAPKITTEPGSPDTTVDFGNAVVTFKIINDWGEGYQCDVTIQNKTSSVLQNWRLSFALDRGISSLWSAQTVSHEGTRYTFDAQSLNWNKDLPAGGKITFGFIGSPGRLTGPPTNFALRFTGESQPMPTPSPTPTPAPSPTSTPQPTATPAPTPLVSLFSVEDSTVDEPSEGTSVVQVNVILNPAPPAPATVKFATKDGSAKSGEDYVATSGTLRFEAGETGQTIPITIRSDAAAEGLETFTIDLSSPEGAAIARGTASITIRKKPAKAARYNWGEALQKSLYFYDAQRSGPLPPNFRVAWRGDSALSDGVDVGVDLTGGYYDAGDHVKFGLPMAGTMTLLSWGGIDYVAAYQRSGQMPELLDAVRWGTDWLMKAHAAETVFYGQVGNGSADHSYWGPAEKMTMARPAYRIDADHPGSEVTGEASAALAAASILFRNPDPAYSAKLLTHARSLFAFAYDHQGTYTKAIPDAAAFYNSNSGYQDELMWAAAWLYRATRDPDYLAKAEAIYDQHFAHAELRWTHSWDDKTYGALILLAELTGKQTYKDAVQRWLNYWTVGNGNSRIKYTPGGLAWLDTWGSLRYASTTAFLAFIYADRVGDEGTRYRDFARRQMEYIMGSNPQHRSYVVGLGQNPPKNPHHRSAHGSPDNNITNPPDNRHTLYGALVGGPAAPSDDAYSDDRENYVSNEVALDYNAGFTGALARLFLEQGGHPLPNFPERE